MLMTIIERGRINLWNGTVTYQFRVIDTRTQVVLGAFDSRQAAERYLRLVKAGR